MSTTDFDEFVSQHYVVVLMKVREVLGSKGTHQDAEDVTQEVFLQHWRELPALEEDRQHTGVLLRSAWRRSIEWLRKAGNSRLGEIIEDPRSEFSDAAQAQEDFEQMKAAFWSLPEGDRKLLFLRYFQNYTLEKCARLTGLRNKQMAQHRLTQILSGLRSDAEHGVRAPHFN